MKSIKSDPKVKISAVRNCEQKVKSAKMVSRENSSQTCLRNVNTSPKEVLLDEPGTCSSELFFNYLSEVKKASPPPLTVEELKKSNLNIKITKKLNFHFNDKIYRNLIELNTRFENEKNKKDKSRSVPSVRVKRDLEPNIEDFYQNSDEKDIPPNVPIIKPKFIPVKPAENGHLHKLVASFENL